MSLMWLRFFETGLKTNRTHSTCHKHEETKHWRKWMYRRRRKGEGINHQSLFTTIFKWFIPVVCDYNIKYQKISGGWVFTTFLHYVVIEYTVLFCFITGCCGKHTILTDSYVDRNCWSRQIVCWSVRPSIIVCGSLHCIVWNIFNNSHNSKN